MQIAGVPKDYAVTRVGVPKIGEEFLGHGGKITVATEDMVSWISENYPVAIIAIQTLWVHPQHHNKMQFPFEIARFRNHPDEPWTYGELVRRATTSSDYKWVSGDGMHWKYCNIYSKDGSIPPGCTRHTTHGTSQ